MNHMESQKPNYAGFLLHNRLPILLVVLSFLLFYYFKLDFVSEWDGFGYIKNIYDHSRSNLNLGRPGFVYSFIPVWELCNKVFTMSILEFYQVITAANLIFSSLIILLAYQIAGRITRNKLIALATAITLIFSRDFIRLAGNTLIEPMMIFMVVLSYFCYVTAINRKNLFYFYLSAFIFGYAFEVKEAALLSIFFFPVFLSLASNESKYFKAKNHLLFIVIFIVAALLMPFYFYLKDGEKYLHSIYSTASHNRFHFGNWQQIYRIMKYGFGIVLFPLVGFIILLIRKKYTKLLVVLSLFIPNIIFSFYGNMDNRYFVFGYISLAILTGYCFFYTIGYAQLVLKFSKKALPLYFSIFLIVLASWNFANFYRPLIKENEYSKYLQGYGLMLLNNFPENAVFIIGDRSALMGQYYIPFTKSRKKLIWSGWSWPRKELGKVVERDFSRGKRIIIDLGKYL